MLLTCRRPRLAEEMTLSADGMSSCRSLFLLGTSKAECAPWSSTGSRAAVAVLSICYSFCPAQSSKISLQGVLSVKKTRIIRVGEAC